MNILNIDMLDSLKYIPEGSVDLILTDLPYGTTQCKWDEVIPFEKMWNIFNRVIKPNGVIVLFGSEPFSSRLRLSNIKAFKYDWVWNKVQATGFLNANKQPLRSHELIHVFYNSKSTYNPQKTVGHIHKKAYRGSKNQTEVYNHVKNSSMYDSSERFPISIQVFPKDTQKSSLHPTQKPVALCEYLIRTYTNPGDQVFDATMGSGTTAIACLNERRSFIGVENDVEIFEVAKK